MELMVFIHRTEEGELEIAVTGPVLAESEREAREAIALLESCPVLEQAKLALPYVPGTLADLYAGARAAYPDGHRYSADNMWTHAPIDDLLPGLRRIAETMPGAPSHMLWMNWRPDASPGASAMPERPEMAYSVEDDTYIALYGVWEDPAEDDVNVALGNRANARDGAIRQAASSSQTRTSATDLRASWETGSLCVWMSCARDMTPSGRFHSWMGRPNPKAP